MVQEILTLGSLAFREKVIESDKEQVRSIVESTGFFSAAEVAVAVELVEERLAKGIGSGYYFLFAEQNTNVMGYSCFGPIPGTKFSFDLYWIVVHNLCRGLGLGRELLRKSEAAIAKLGGHRIYVETSSRVQYEPTRSFYVACGYKKEATLKDFYAPGDSKIIYLKVI